MDRNLALELVRVTEAAAVAAAAFVGRGDEKAADQAAVDAMRKAFDKVDIDGLVVIGEGERDQAPMLHIGERVGARQSHSPKVAIALDPLEGTTICAQGYQGALSVIAVADEKDFLHAPDVYMKKMACGVPGVLDFNLSATENIKNVAEKISKPIHDLTVVVLDRPRHQELIEEIRQVGARISLIRDGDVSGGLACGQPHTGIDLLLGTGGAPEGVITAAALKCLGGDFLGQLIFDNDEQKARAQKMGITDFDKVYGIDDLVKGETFFCATGVTDGTLLSGVKIESHQRMRTYSVVMRSLTGTVRYVQATHNLNKKQNARA